MALSKVVETVETKVLPDGRVQLKVSTKVYEGGVQSGVLVAERHDLRMIEVGDDVTGEDELTRDIVNGTLFSAQRITDREAAKAALSVREV